MRLFTVTAYDNELSGTNPDYSPRELDVLLARAEKYFVSLRTSNPAGTPKVSISLETSNDRIRWTEKKLLWFELTYSTTAVGLYYVTDTGSGVGGGFTRVKVTLTGTNPGGHFQIIVTGRGRRVGAQPLPFDLTPQTPEAADQIMVRA